MVLSSPVYFLFLGLLFFLYWPLARYRLASLALLLFANWFFYARWDLAYLALIPVAGTADFLIALGLGRWRRPALRRLLVAASLAVNLGLLATLKYTPFFLENWAHLAGRAAPQWNWTLPLGLSFYAFQALTYTLEVYRRDARPTTSLLAHLTAVSFFPTTLAGPITRVATLLAQLESPVKSLAPTEGGSALFLIGLGLLKKFAIADYLGANLVDRVFDFPNLYTSAEVVAAVLAYTLQLYYDFSGYTDIATGSALLLGLKLPANFNRPYGAGNIADFWRRWHITLSNWLRDYLYFSLPGLRSKWRIFTYANLLVTMTLGGLWHGPGWNFVLWGALHGLGLAVTHAWQGWRGRRRPSTSALARAGRVGATMLFVSFAWIFFRAPDLDGALAVLARIGSLTFSLENVSGPLALTGAIAAAAHYLPRHWLERLMDRYSAAPFYIQGPALAGLVVGLHYVVSTGAAPFIYTRF